MRSSTDVALDRHLSPVNKTAARVVSKGIHWVPDKIVQTADSINPVPVKRPLPASGVSIGDRRGFLVVIGQVIEEVNKGGPRYLCRCACGYYTQRRAKSIKNEANSIDACERCRQKQYLERENYRKAFGKWRE